MPVLELILFKQWEQTLSDLLDRTANFQNWYALRSVVALITWPVLVQREYDFLIFS